jgi:hypothetical protein
MNKLLIVLCFGCTAVRAQDSNPVVLTVDVANLVEYYEDVPITSFATTPAITPQNVGNGKNFFSIVIFADIVAINGQPAKGVYVSNNRVVAGSPTPTPGQAITDTAFTGLREDIFKFLNADGTSIGSITALGLSGGVPSPGSAATQTGGDWVITGGSGAFLGVKGEMGGTGMQKGIRPASMAEDPANRRSNGGGAFQFVMYLQPASRPQIATANNAPAVVHASDFTPVTTAKPAAAGEILALYASGLGPVQPNTAPGKSFPENPLALANGPVQVTVNGESAPVLAAVGYPGTLGGYQVNFQLPSGVTKGTAALQLGVAWITGTPVSIAIQ